MLDQEKVMELRVLHKQARSLKVIAREAGVSRNTVRKYVRDGAQATPRRRASRLDAYMDFLRERLAQAPLSAVVLQRELADRGCRIGVSRLKEVLAGLRPTIAAAPPQRFETPPGVQAQVDFAHFEVAGLRCKAFVAVLGHSRWLYARFLPDERIESLRAGHEGFFEAIGGVPQQLLYDNPKTIVLERDRHGAGKHRFHPALWELAAHYGFVPRLCRPRRAQTKGKVERAIRYLRENFFLPTHSRMQADGEAITLASLNLALERWLAGVANVRRHRELQQRPCDRLPADQRQLLPLPTRSVAQTLRELQAIAPPPARDPTPLQRPLAGYQAIQEAA